MIGEVRAAPHGAVPLVVKDTFDVAGWPTTAGARLVASTALPVDTDAAIVARLREVGFAPIAKANMVEFAFGTHGLNPWFGTPRNPLAPERIPGGSSSGSAVSVALGVAPLALGTDTGGSVRIPAACCGVLGLKLGHGVVPLAGCWPLAPSLDSAGLLARELSILEEAVGALVAGPPRSTPPTLRRLEVGIASLDQRVAEVVGSVPTLDCETLGWSELYARGSELLVAEAYEVLAGFLREAHRLDPRTVARLGGAEREPTRVAALRARLDEDRRHAAVWLEGTVLALPVLPGAVPTLSTFEQVVLNQLTLPVNYLGLPALALPAASGRRNGEDAGIPFSLQLIGPPGGELMVLETARMLRGGAAW
jgi:amidase